MSSQSPNKKRKEKYFASNLEKKKKKSIPFIETNQVLVKGCRKINPQNSFTNVKQLIKNQHQYLIIALQNNITRPICLQKLRNKHLLETQKKIHATIIIESNSQISCYLVIGVSEPDFLDNNFKSI